MHKHWETSIYKVFASVAQLDRALASEARCRGFESLQVHEAEMCDLQEQRQAFQLFVLWKLWTHKTASKLLRIYEY